MTIDLARFRVLATDLDGTLLRPDLTVSATTRTSLRAAAQRGVRIVFVTGRPPRWMPPVVATTGHVGTAICANGAVVLDAARETIVSTHVIPPQTLAAAAEAARRALGPGSLVAVEQAVVGPMTSSRLHHEDGFLPPELATGPVSLRDLIRLPGAVKLLARAPGDPAGTDEAAAVVAAEMGGSVTVTHSSRTHRLIEIAPAGIDKAAGLADLLAQSGLAASDVVAVGDMPNDIPMLSWAGHGLAVASAHRAVIAAADAVIPDPEHDGVAAVADALGR